MQHEVTVPSPPLTVLDGAATVHMVPVWRDNLVWVIAPTDTDTAWAVDGPEAQPVLDWCAAHGRRLAGILNTHTHHDHVGINTELAKTGALEGLRVYGPARAADAVPGITDRVDEGDMLDIDGLPVRVMRTEGHLDGHVSYVLGDVVFCGDTLFAGGCGYLFDGPPATMFDSLLRLVSLPGHTRVCCAHEYTQDNLRFAWMVEPDNEALAARIQRDWALRAEGRCTVPSTIDDERATNPFVRPGSTTLRAEVLERLPDADLSSHAAVFAATRRLKDRKDHRQRTDDVLPL